MLEVVVANKSESESSIGPSKHCKTTQKGAHTNTKMPSWVLFYFIVGVIALSALPSASALACFYCSEHYLTCETYQRYQLCQANEDRCYVIRSADQIMQGCGQSFMPYCSQQAGVCCTGDLCNCYGRQCPLRTGAPQLARPSILLQLSTFMGIAGFLAKLSS